MLPDPTALLGCISVAPQVGLRPTGTLLGSWAVQMAFPKDQHQILGLATDFHEIKIPSGSINRISFSTTIKILTSIKLME